MPQIPLPFVDYTARDFESIKAALVEYLKQRFPDDFTDFNESQLGIAMLELVAYSYSIISFMLDRQVNEVYIETARERQSVINLAALLNYKLSTGTAASVDVFLDTATLTGLSGPVVVSRGTQVTVGELSFEADKVYTIQRTGSSPNFSWTVNGVTTSTPFISLIEGETVTDTFTSDGSSFLTLLLSRAPLIDGSLSAVVANVVWTLVDSLVLGDPEDPNNTQIYEVTTDADDKPTLRFGDGTSGQIPVEGSIIVAGYRVGGGSAGNVAAGTFNQNISATHNGTTAVSIPLTNPNKASGGTDRESLDHARLFAPAFARTMDRAVTYNDYFALCNGFTDGISGVITKAGIIADPTDGLSNVVTIYVWSEDSDGNLVPASQPLRDALFQFLDQRRVLSVSISPVQNGANIPVDITVLVRVDSAFNEADTLEAARKAIIALFTETRVKFGNELRLSWVSEALQSLAGISWVHVKEFGGLTDPKVIQGSTLSLEAGTTTATQPSLPSQVDINAPVARIANYYSNYRLSAASQIQRIITSTASLSVPPYTARLTCEADFSPPIAPSIPYVTSHPRRIRLDSAAEAVNNLYDHHVLVLDPATAGIETQEAAIISYTIEPATGAQVALVNIDWFAAPLQGDPYSLVPDIQVIESQAIVPGTIQVLSIRGSTT